MCVCVCVCVCRLGPLDPVKLGWGPAGVQLTRKEMDPQNTNTGVDASADVQAGGNVSREFESRGSCVEVLMSECTVNRGVPMQGNERRSRKGGTCPLSLFVDVPLSPFLDSKARNRIRQVVTPSLSLTPSCPFCLPSLSRYHRPDFGCERERSLSLEA